MKKGQLSKVLLPAAIVLLGAALILLLVGQKEPPAAGKPIQTPAAQTTAPAEQTAAPAQSTAPASSTTEPIRQETAPTEENRGETRPTEPTRTEPEEEPWSEPAGTEPVNLEFPCLIPGTELVITKVSPYDGLFLEDGGDTAAENVCAIVVTNTADRDLEYAEITLDREGTLLDFRVSGLTAGSSAMVLEYSGAAYAEGDYLDCTGSCSMVDVFELSEELVSVTENADGSLTVTNLSGESIPCVRVFYKFYMTDVDVYVGGITYTAKLVDLAAGASRQIQPSHYLAGMSRIVMVKTYDTAQ